MTFDVIVVGAGVMGASAAWQLASRGQKVLLLDQGGIPNVLGSSFGDSRLFRMAYYEQAGYVPLLWTALSLWRELESETGLTLLNQCGGIYLGDPDGELISGSIRAAEEHGMHHIALTGHEVMREYPQFTVPEHFGGFYDGGAGFLYATRCVVALIEQSLACGATVHGFETVLAWTQDGDGIKVTTTRGEYLAAKLIITAGPWVNEILELSRVALRTTRQSVAYVWPTKAELFNPDHFPVYAIEAEDKSFYYGVPRDGIQPGVKIARHDLGPEIDPSSSARTNQAEDELTIRSALARYLPLANGPLLSLSNCVYTNSPDSHFILDFHPSESSVIIGTGFSGHGFKFGPAIGSALANAAIDGRFAEETAFLGLSRF